MNEPAAYVDFAVSLRQREDLPKDRLGLNLPTYLLDISYTASFKLIWVPFFLRVVSGCCGCPVFSLRWVTRTENKTDSHFCFVAGTSGHVAERFGRRVAGIWRDKMGFEDLVGLGKLRTCIETYRTYCRTYKWISLEVNFWIPSFSSQNLSEEKFTVG